MQRLVCVSDGYLFVDTKYFEFPGRRAIIGKISPSMMLQLTV